MRPVGLIERTLRAHAVFRGEVVAPGGAGAATSDIAVRVEHAVLGPFAPGDEVRLPRTGDFRVGDRVYVFLSDRSQPGPAGEPPAWLPLNLGSPEGVEPILLGEAYLRTAPGSERQVVISRWPRIRAVAGNPWRVEDVDAALAAVRLLFTWDGARARVAADRGPDVRAAARSDNELLAALCTEALAWSPP